MKQILIVEDDSFLNKMLDYNLTADGYGVTSALNARTAAEAIRQREFDLVLLDPPFHYDTLNEVLPALADKVAPGGVVLAESEREAALPERAGALVLAKQYYYGKIMVSRYEKEEQA